MKAVFKSQQMYSLYTWLYDLTKNAAQCGLITLDNIHT